MTRNRKIKTHLKTLTFILMVLVSSMFMMFPMNNSDSHFNSEKLTEDNQVDNENNPINDIESPISSKVGLDAWWNSSWLYRQLINITNPVPGWSFTNYPTSIVFNYTASKYTDPTNILNSQLDDIRIVQNGVLRKYYFQQNYPENDLVTVWFDVDIDTEADTDHTYIYFNGSDTVSTDPTYFMDSASSSSSDAFGLIRNGNFELDQAGKIGVPGTNWFGWTYTNDIPLDYDDKAENVAGNNQHGLTDVTINQSRVIEGNCSFKWGDPQNYLYQKPTDLQDYEGTLYGYPFIIPTVTGLGAELKIKVYRNVRTYSEQAKKKTGFFLRLAENYDDIDIQNHHEVIEQEDWLAVKKEISRVKYRTFVQDKTVEGGDTVDTRSKVDPPYPDPNEYNDNGDLTGYVEIDVSSLAGRLVFLEAGLYGKEAKRNPEDKALQTAFAQIDDVKYNYEIETALNDEIQIVAGELIFITKDVDGRIVPDAKVRLFNDDTYERIDYTSDQDGSVTFSNVPYGLYNVTVNYSLQHSGKEEEVYDSRDDSTEFLAQQIGATHEITLDMATIDFEVVDYGGYPLEYGYINISNTVGSEALEILNLDPNGKATFRWRNQSQYYFKIYYNNTDYSLNPTLLNESYVDRDSYARSPGGSKFQNQVFNVNEVNKAPADSIYHVQEYVYTNGSATGFGNIKIINTTITLTNMDDQLTNVSIYYIDRDNNTEAIIDYRIYFNDDYGLGDDSATIEIDLMTVDNAKLSSENREAHGLLIDIWGENDTVCQGVINIDMDETWNVYNRTIISKLNIRVLGDGLAISDAIVTIKSNSTIYGQTVTTTLESDKDIGGGLALTENNLPFMYLRGYYYNISMVWQDNNEFNVTGPDPDQWAPNALPWVTWYNYSLSKYNFTLEFDINLGGIDPTDYKLRFDNITYDEDVIWNDNVSVLIFFNSTIDNWSNDAPETDPDTLNAIVKRGDTTYLTFQKSDWQSSLLGAGYFVLEFNTSSLSAGFYGLFYKIIVSGTKSPYIDPSDKELTFFIGGKESNITLHDYYSPTLDLIEDYQVTQYFGEEVNITIKFEDNNTHTPLMGALIAFDWLNLGDDETGFFADPINIGYFTLTLDTSLAEIVGPRTVKITAKIENYEEQVILVSLRVVERPTSLNGQTELVYSNSKIWVQDPHYYNYTYRDLLKPINNITGDLDIAIYSWQQLDENGNVIVGKSGDGSLSQNADKTYTLNFGTSYRPVGFYQIYITVAKDNYEERFALLNIEIRLREFDADLDATSLDDDQITVVKGKDVKFEIELLDTTRGNIPLTGAKVVLEIDDEEYEFDEDDPGIYTYTFSTEEIDAFYTSQTFTGEIIIKAVNFTSDEIDITIVVTMEEVFPGMPTFYFIMLVAVIAGTLGALVSYRTIQQARIPKHVKKIRLIKKKIKARDSIPSISILTKEQMIMKQFSGAWKDLDLALEDTLGIKEVKSKIPAEEKKSLKQKGGDV